MPPWTDDPNRRKRLMVAVVLVILLLLPALSVIVIVADAVLGVTVTAPLGVAGATPVRSADAPAEVNASPVPAIERLGRWNGEGFEAVAQGSIDDEVVTVISHGWAPGYRSVFDLLQAGSDQLVTAWDPRLVDSNGESMMENFSPLAQALQDDAPDSAVVMFSWVDQSATGSNPLQVRGAADATEVNGHRLAIALEQALAEGFRDGGGQVHLIGHSFGARVVSVAATALDEPPRQVTLLDSPEVLVARLGGAMNSLQYVLPRLDVGRGEGEVFVDNYVSRLGHDYHGERDLWTVVDVTTRPPSSEDVGEQHEFAVVWYADSVRGEAADVGYAWSPVRGGDVGSLAAAYRQPEVDRPLALEVQVPTAEPSTLDVDVTGVSTESWSGDRDDDGMPAVGGGGASTAQLEVTTDGDSLWLDLDLVLDGRPGDLLTVAVDGRQRFQTAVGTGSPAPAGGDGAGGSGATGDADGADGADSYVTLVDVAPGSHTVTFTVSGPDGTSAPGRDTVAVLDAAEVSSTTGIVRNLSERETDLLVLGALVVAAVVVVGLGILMARALRRFGHRRTA